MSSMLYVIACTFNAFPLSVEPRSQHRGKGRWLMGAGVSPNPVALPVSPHEAFVSLHINVPQVGEDGFGGHTFFNVGRDQIILTGRGIRKTESCISLTSVRRGKLPWQHNFRPALPNAGNSP